MDVENPPFVDHFPRVSPCFFGLSTSFCMFTPGTKLDHRTNKTFPQAVQPFTNRDFTAVLLRSPGSFYYSGVVWRCGLVLSGAGSPGIWLVSVRNRQLCWRNCALGRYSCQDSRHAAATCQCGGQCGCRKSSSLHIENHTLGEEMNPKHEVPLRLQEPHQDI